ncbi:MAG: hypothetical protein K5919_07015 [Clostridiales bacterium]|nr:hypothetical protein [Clostridiales bacterium]
MREIYIVNATQAVVSEAHPEGLYSVVTGYPKTFDSRNYNATEQNPNGDTDAALRAAKAEYFSRLSANYAGSASRVMATVTLETAQGRTIMSECIGAFPDMTPAPEPEPDEADAE